MGSLLGVVTCAPWLLCFGIRLAIQDCDRTFADEPRQTVNIGTHASHIDELSMMVWYWLNRHRQIPPCAVVKRETLFTPFYGKFAWLVGNIMVSRGSSKEVAVRSMKRVSKRIEQGYVTGAFPEG